MCLIAFDWQPHQHDWLTLVANRDEFYHRETRALHLWDANFYAGKDLLAGGSWLGIDKSARFAALTNIRAPGQGPESPLSRGHLITRYLEQDISPEHFVQQVSSTAADYGLFNLIVGDRHAVYYCHNHPDFYAQRLTPGIFGLSNAHLNTPWPKTELAKDKLKLWQKARRTPLTSLLDSRDIVNDEQLPQTGIPLEWERALSSQFILTSDYGTRSSTSLLGRGKHLAIEEISWGKNGDASAKHTYSIEID